MWVFVLLAGALFPACEVAAFGHQLGDAAPASLLLGANPLLCNGEMFPFVPFWYLLCC